MSRNKAIVLLSGGLDSTTTLYYAIDKGYDCYALIFDYGQRHRREIKHAKKIAQNLKVKTQILRIKLPWKGSSLLGSRGKGQVPRKKIHGIPLTYVPARNTIFLSFALSYAEAIGAKAIFIGANAIDYSGYPDCRPHYYKAFHHVIRNGTMLGNIRVYTPLINLTKKQIVKLGRKLKAPLEKTWSCYQGNRKPCNICDSCKLRAKGFAGIIKA